MSHNQPDAAVSPHTDAFGGAGARSIAAGRCILHLRYTSSKRTVKLYGLFVEQVDIAIALLDPSCRLRGVCLLMS